MQISPIRNYYNNINFASSKRTTYKKPNDEIFITPYYDPFGFLGEKEATIVNANNTYFFRQDIPWYKLTDYLETQFPQDEKVNIYSFACSDGSEAYSVAIDLITNLGYEKASRYFPIIATDVDPEIIKSAKSGSILASEEDLKRIEQALKSSDTIATFFDIERNDVQKAIPFYEEKLCYVLHPKEILSKNVVFKCEDIEDSIDNIQGDNNFIMARNFWKYLSGEKSADATLKLRKKMNSSSRLMLGDFDFYQGYPYFIKHLGFKPDTEYFKYVSPIIFKIDENEKTAYLENAESWKKAAKLFHQVYSQQFREKE